MNFDRNCKTQTVQNENSCFDLTGNIQKLPTIKRVYLYIFLMALVGAATGAIKYQLESVNCSVKNDCWMAEPAQRKVRELGIGALGGVIAASLISIPALLEDS